MSAFRVLIVCTGNQCRSPMAEGILRHLLRLEAEGRARSGVDPLRAPSEIVVSSAGTAGDGRWPATAEAQEACRERGINIEGHRSQALTAELLAASDLVLAMESHHAAACRDLLPAVTERVFLLREYGGGEVGSGVADPVGGDLPLYRDTCRELLALLQAALPRILAAAHEGSTG